MVNANTYQPKPPASLLTHGRMVQWYIVTTNSTGKSVNELINALFTTGASGGLSPAAQGIYLGGCQDVNFNDDTQFEEYPVQGQSTPIRMQTTSTTTMTLSNFVTKIEDLVNIRGSLVPGTGAGLQIWKSEGDYKSVDAIFGVRWRISDGSTEFPANSTGKWCYDAVYGGVDCTFELLNLNYPVSGIYTGDMEAKVQSSFYAKFVTAREGAGQGTTP